MPVDSTPYCSTSAFDAMSPLLQEVVAALDSLNVTVEQVQMKLNTIYSYSGEAISIGVAYVWLSFCNLCPCALYICIAT